MTPISRLLLASVLLVLAPGCATFATLQTAKPIGKGNLQFALEPSSVGMGGDRIPRADASVRYGATDDIDVGGRIGLGGIDLLGKFRLTAPDAFPILSVAPSLGLMSIGASLGDGSGSTSGSLNFVTITLPLLIGFPIGDHELVVGPKLHDVLTIATGSSGGTGGSAAGNLLLAGGVLGFALKPVPGFTFFPEVAVLKPIMVSTAASGSEVESFIDTGGGWMYQISVGLIFGGM